MNKKDTITAIENSTFDELKELHLTIKEKCFEISAQIGDYYGENPIQLSELFDANAESDVISDLGQNTTLSYSHSRALERAKSNQLKKMEKMMKSIHELKLMASKKLIEVYDYDPDDLDVLYPDVDGEDEDYEITDSGKTSGNVAHLPSWAKNISRVTTCNLGRFEQ